MGNTLQATKVLYQKMFQLKVLFDKMLSYLDRLIQHQTRLPLPMTWKRVSVLSESSLINLKCNSKTNTTVTLTKSSVLWVLRGRWELHLQHLDFALDVDWHCLPILKTPDETPVVLDVGVQDGQQDPQEATLFCWAPLQLTNIWRPLQIQPYFRK